MFVREKRIGDYSYLYLVETVRENGKTKQRIIRNLGRKEVVEAGGDLDRLARSAGVSRSSAPRSRTPRPRARCWNAGTLTLRNSERNGNEPNFAPPQAGRTR